MTPSSRRNSASSASSYSTAQEFVEQWYSIPGGASPSPPPSLSLSSWPEPKSEPKPDHPSPYPQCVNVITPSSPSLKHFKTSPPVLTPPDNMVSDPMYELLADAPPDKPLSDHMHELSTRDQQCVNGTSTPSSSTEEHVPTSQSPPLRSLTPPDKLHPTLSCWIKNMDKLSSLINCLEELASSTPAEHQSQLSIQVMALRAKSKKQQEHFIEFLRLSEEYANKYLLDISAEIDQQSFFLEKLEGRVETAKKLREEAVDLQRFYESETVATMENLGATGKASSCSLLRQYSILTL